MNQQWIVSGVCLIVVIASLGVAVSTLATGQIGRQGLDALFLVSVCLLLAVAFSIYPLLNMPRGAVGPAVQGMATSTAADLVQNKLYVVVWFYLLALTAVEVVLAYVHLFSTGMMLLILMVLSLIKAGMIVAYFMHMKSETRAFIISLVPACLVVIGLLFAFFPDAYRLLELRVM